MSCAESSPQVFTIGIETLEIRSSVSGVYPFRYCLAACGFAFTSFVALFIISITFFVVVGFSVANFVLTIPAPGQNGFASVCSSGPFTRIFPTPLLWIVVITGSIVSTASTCFDAIALTCVPIGISTIVTSLSA